MSYLVILGIEFEKPCRISKQHLQSFQTAKFQPKRKKLQLWEQKALFGCLRVKLEKQNQQPQILLYKKFRSKK